MITVTFRSMCEGGVDWKRLEGSLHGLSEEEEKFLEHLGGTAIRNFRLREKLRCLPSDFASRDQKEWDLWRDFQKLGISSSSEIIQSSLFQEVVSSFLDRKAGRENPFHDKDFDELNTSVFSSLHGNRAVEVISTQKSQLQKLNKEVSLWRNKEEALRLKVSDLENRNTTLENALNKKEEALALLSQENEDLEKNVSSLRVQLTETRKIVQNRKREKKPEGVSFSCHIPYLPSEKQEGKEREEEGEGTREEKRGKGDNEENTEKDRMIQSLREENLLLKKKLELSSKECQRMMMELHQFS